MQVDIQKLIDLNLLHIPNTAGLMYPNISKHQAGAKLRNKINRINGNKLTDVDWELIRKIFE